MTHSTGLCRAHPKALVRYLGLSGDAHIFECPDCAPPALIRLTSESVRALQSGVADKGVEYASDDGSYGLNRIHGTNDGAGTVPGSTTNDTEVMPKGGI